ncbi:hypothetical protein ACJZ2D_016715 [Fusarium nematophilum]
MSILTLRLLDRPVGITRLVDRIAIESTLYQIFLVTTGLWSDSTGLHHDLYADFWTQAERLLDRSMFFPRRPMSLNSPVLGIPVSIFRLTRSLRQQCRSRFPYDQAILDMIRGEVVTWEEVLLTGQEPNGSTSEGTDREERAYRDTGHLYAIIASVLLEQLSRNQIRPGAGPVAASDSWQVRKAVQILREHQYDDGWTRLFVGNWPVYTLGFLMSSAEDIELVQADLRRRWNLTSFAQITRFSRDLENMWSARERATDTALLACHPGHERKRLLQGCPGGKKRVRDCASALCDPLRGYLSKLRAADAEVAERITIVENTWTRTRIQVEFMEPLGPILDAEHHRVLGNIIEVLAENGTGGELRPGWFRFSRGVRRGKYAFVKDSLDEVIQDMEEWQRRFDPSWFLIMRMANPIIDQQLTRQHQRASQGPPASPTPSRRPAPLPPSQQQRDQHNQSFSLATRLQTAPSPLSLADGLRTALRPDGPHRSVFLPRTDLDFSPIPYCNAKAARRDSSDRWFLVDRLTCRPTVDVTTP